MTNEYKQISQVVTSYLDGDKDTDMVSYLTEKVDNSSVDTPEMIIIPNLQSFLEAYQFTLAQFSSLYKEGPKKGIHFIFGSTKTGLFKTDINIKYVKDNLTTALIAGRLYDQSLVPSKMTSREPRLSDDEIYLYQNGESQKLKMSKQVVD